ncbi:MAG: glycoside hydrolase family 172 protein [Bacteroidales bacterium]
MRTILKSLIFAAIISVFQVVQGQEVTTTSLINELTDLRQLAEYPIPGFRSVQYSSYDRRTVSPDKPGWFANDDGFGGEPIPGFLEVIKKPDSKGIGEYLICDVKGPGAIVRLWTAQIAGELMVWLDQEKDPVYNGLAKPFFLHTYEAFLKEKPKTEWTGSINQNMASYYPIPFSKGCRMVWKGDLSNLHFYHVQLRLYDQGTRVKTFTVKDIQKNQEKLNHAAAILAEPFKYLDTVLFNAAYETIWLKPGEKKVVKSVTGSAGIKRLAVFVAAQNMEKALRQTILEIRFDGSPWGQVQSPVGDFFGAAPGINPYESLPFTVLDDGRMVCRYFMPFKDSAQVMMENMGDQEVTVIAKVVTKPYEWKDGTSMHFRARWRVNHELLADPRQVKDIPYLLIRGKGRMVGAACYLLNPTSVPSSAGNWWGEGDEKIFIDDYLKPSFIGTGSEDYYNYAWSSEELFDYGYCGQPRNDGPANRGFVTNYRWHILDNIPFDKSFDFFMELYSHRAVDHFSYARMVYTYAVPGAHDDHLVITKSDVRQLELPADWWPEAAGAAGNSIFYQVENILFKPQNIELVKDPMWSAKQMVFWKPLSKSDSLTLLLPATKTGKFRINLTVARTAGGGKMELMLDNKPIMFNGADIVDLSTSFRSVARNISTESLDLTEGIHVLTIKPAGDKPGPIGLDFIWIQGI